MPVEAPARMRESPEPADAADALAVALADYHLRLRPLHAGLTIDRIRSSKP